MAAATASAAIAGYCRDGGLIRRRDEFGNPVIIRQREICDSVAPRTLEPGEVDPRPRWPADAVVRQRVLRAKGAAQGVGEGVTRRPSAQP